MLLNNFTTKFALLLEILFLIVRHPKLEFALFKYNSDYIAVASLQSAKRAADDFIHEGLLCELLVYSWCACFLGNAVIRLQLRLREFFLAMATQIRRYLGFFEFQTQNSRINVELNF